MKTFLKTFPSALIGVRFALGPIIWWSTVNGMSPWWFMAGFVTAFLTDYFDGIIARRLNVSTPALRLADSWVDTWFYFWVVLSIWASHSDSLKNFAFPIIILLGLQITEWIYGYIKFRRMTGYHAWLAKAWGLSLFSAIVSIVLFNYDGIAWWLAISLGWLSSIENWLLTLTCPEWRTDVKSIFHVWKGEKIFGERKIT